MVGPGLIANACVEIKQGLGHLYLIVGTTLIVGGVGDNYFGFGFNILTLRQRRTKMTVDVVGISNREVPQNKEAKDRLNPELEEYTVISKKLIRSIAPKIRIGLAEQLLSSDDAIANIASQIMFADWKWNGLGTIQGYRKQCAEWAIKGYIGRDVQRSKKYMMSLNYKLDDDGNELCELIPDSEVCDPHDIVAEKETQSIQTELIDSLLGSGVLTEPQEQCIRLHYLQELSFTDISKDLGISREAVRQLVGRGMLRLRKLANDEE